MVVYIVVFALVLLVLWGSYRALAGGETLAAEDYRTVLARLTDFTAERATELRAALEAPAPAPGTAVDPLQEVAVAARKKLSAYQQQLGRFEGSDTEGGPLDAARSLLSGSIESLGWACRMIEPGTYRVNPGLQQAVATLRRHGEQGLDSARMALDESAGDGVLVAPAH